MHYATKDPIQNLKIRVTLTQVSLQRTGPVALQVRAPWCLPLARCAMLSHRQLGFAPRRLLRKDPCHLPKPRTPSQQPVLLRFPMAPRVNNLHPCLGKGSSCSKATRCLPRRAPCSSSSKWPNQCSCSSNPSSRCKGQPLPCRPLVPSPRLSRPSPNSSSYRGSRGQAQVGNQRLPLTHSMQQRQ